MAKNTESKEYRQKVIRELLSDLHSGVDFEEIKAKFEATFGGVSASEIAEAEQGLIDQGLPVEEITKLCDVHAAVFKGSIEDIHRPTKPQETPGHPAHTLMQENRALERLLEDRVRPHLAGFLAEKADKPDDPEKPGETEAGADITAGAIAQASLLADDLSALSGINTHYERKEQLFFPYMEKHGITAPPKVMWSVDDEVRALIKQAVAMLSGWLKSSESKKATKEAIGAKVEELVAKITDMIFKEDGILLPMVLDAFTQDEWNVIALESRELGYFLIPPPPVWEGTADKSTASFATEDKDGIQDTPDKPSGPTEASASAGTQTSIGIPASVAAPASIGSSAPGASLPSSVPSNAKLVFPTGALSFEQLLGILETVPVDLTFIGEDDTVRYFSRGTERIFARTKAVIGRRVIDCHPPASVPAVEKIIESFKSGRKDHEDFWLNVGDKYVLIRFYAVRSPEGAYLGTLEVAQDIKPIQALTGEKRLADG